MRGEGNGNSEIKPPHERGILVNTTSSVAKPQSLPSKGRKPALTMTDIFH